MGLSTSFLLALGGHPQYFVTVLVRLDHINIVEHCHLFRSHLTGTHLTDGNTRDRPQYQFFPHESVGDDEGPNRSGTVSNKPC
jgi:hypothetical protein